MLKLTIKKTLSFIISICLIISLFTCVSMIPASAATSDLVEFYALNNDYARMEYLKGWTTFKAGNYIFRLDCKIFSGTPTIRIGMDGTFGTSNSNLLNYTTKYDAQCYIYEVTFTLSSDKACNLNIDVGNYGTDGLFACANPELHILDSNGTPSGDNLINTFSSEYYTTSTVNSEKKDKWRTAGKEGNFTCGNLPNGYFDPVTDNPNNTETPEGTPTISSDLIKITASGEWSCLKYTKTSTTIKAGNYRFEMDCKIFSGTPVIKVGNDGHSGSPGGLISGYQSNYVATYNEENYKYIITFTMDSDWTGELGLLIGNYGQNDLAHFAFANPTLYLLDTDGNPMGNSLINTFSDRYYSSANIPDRWDRRNFGAGLFTCSSTIPEGYFDPNSGYEEEKSDYSLNTLDKAYVTFLFDDGRMPFTQECFDLFKSFNMPMCCDVVAERIEGNQTVIDLLLKIQEAGGEILSHTYTHKVITSKNSTVENIEKEFGDSFRLLTSLGFNVHGIIETGNGGEETTADYELMETISRKYYKYSNAYGVSPQYKTNRTWLKNLGLSGAKSSVDNAIKNNKWIILWAHDFSELSKSDMKTLLSYIDSKGKDKVEVVSWNYVYENFATYTGPQVPTKEAIDSVCTSFGHYIKDAVITKQPTCNKKGEKTGYCSICKKESVSEIDRDIDKHGKMIPATCTSPKKCKDCGLEFGGKLDHIYDNGKVTVKPTCKTEGKKIYTCTVCGYTKTATLLANGTHVYNSGNVTKKATCTSTGIKISTCIGCGKPQTEIIEKTPHTYKNACDTNCDICNATRTIKHTYTNATCTQAKTCKVCGTTNGSKLGHSYSTKYKKATTSKDGYSYKECSRCTNQTGKATIYKIKSISLKTKTYTYNGKTKTPTVVVKDSKGKVLKLNTDYTVKKLTNGKTVGKHTVKITFKGKYSGSKTLTFTINPAETKVSKVTAGKKSLIVNVSKKSSQVTGYQIQYSTSKKFTSAKTKTISSYKTTKTTIKGLKSKKTYYVRVRTYKTVNGKKYYSAWSKAKSKKTK